MVNLQQQTLYLTKNLFDTQKYSFFKAWQTLCHELTHYFELYEQAIQSKLAITSETIKLCEGTLTHHRDGHFSLIQRHVSAELYRQLKKLSQKESLKNQKLTSEINVQTPPKISLEKSFITILYST